MQMNRWLSALVLGAAVSAGSARAAVTEDSFLVRSTGDLAELCSAPQSDPLYTAASNFCHGFALGAFRVLQEQDMARRSRHLFCVPNPAPSRNEALAMFVQWVKADAKRSALSGADGIAAFLAQHYPCPPG